MYATYLTKKKISTPPDEQRQICNNNNLFYDDLADYIKTNGSVFVKESWLSSYWISPPIVLSERSHGAGERKDTQFTSEFLNLCADKICFWLTNRDNCSQDDRFIMLARLLKQLNEDGAFNQVVRISPILDMFIDKLNEFEFVEFGGVSLSKSLFHKRYSNKCCRWILFSTLFCNCSIENKKYIISAVVERGRLYNFIVSLTPSLLCRFLGIVNTYLYLLCEHGGEIRTSLQRDRTGREHDDHWNKFRCKIFEYALEYVVTPDNDQDLICEYFFCLFRGDSSIISNRLDWFLKLCALKSFTSPSAFSFAENILSNNMFNTDQIGVIFKNLFKSGNTAMLICIVFNLYKHDCKKTVDQLCIDFYSSAPVRSLREHDGELPVGISPQSSSSAFDEIFSFCTRLLRPISEQVAAVTKSQFTESDRVSQRLYRLVLKDIVHDNYPLQRACLTEFLSETRPLDWHFTNDKKDALLLSLQTILPLCFTNETRTVRSLREHDGGRETWRSLSRPSELPVGISPVLSSNNSRAISLEAEHRDYKLFIDNRAINWDGIDGIKKKQAVSESLYLLGLPQKYPLFLDYLFDENFCKHLPRSYLAFDWDENPPLLYDFYNMEEVTTPLTPTQKKNCTVFFDLIVENNISCWSCFSLNSTMMYSCEKTIPRNDKTKRFFDVYTIYSDVLFRNNALIGVEDGKLTTSENETSKQNTVKICNAEDGTFKNFVRVVESFSKNAKLWLMKFTLFAHIKDGDFAYFNNVESIPLFKFLEDSVQVDIKSSIAYAWGTITDASLFNEQSSHSFIKISYHQNDFLLDVSIPPSFRTCSSIRSLVKINCKVLTSKYVTISISDDNCRIRAHYKFFNRITIYDLSECLRENYLRVLSGIRDQMEFEAFLWFWQAVPIRIFITEPDFEEKKFIIKKTQQCFFDIKKYWNHFRDNNKCTNPIVIDLESCYLKFCKQ